MKRKPRTRRKRAVIVALAGGIAAAALAWLLLSRPNVPAFNSDRTLDDVHRIVAFGPRVPGTAAHAATLEFLRGRLDSLADQVTLQAVSVPTPEGDTLNGTNVIASFNLRPDRNVRIMLGAHWDSRPRADRDPDIAKRNLPVLGANDGASGTAVLLEMARILHQNPLDIGVDLLLFDLEDAGVDTTIPFAAGSEQFAAANGHYRPTFGIIVDMVCDKDLRLPREASSERLAKRVVDRVWKAARDVGATSFLDETGPPVHDDHVAFLTRGIPVIDIIQSPFPDYWHTTFDTVDKCSAESLQQVGNVLTRVIYTQ